MNNEPLDQLPDDTLEDNAGPAFFFNKPGLLLRFKSMMIDGLIVIALMMLMAGVLNGLEVASGTVRGIGFFAIFLYEPLFTAINRTVGQAVMGLRVRRLSDLKNGVKPRTISFPSSFLRYVIKGLLGWISLLTIHGDRYGQAIHDKTANSVVVFAVQGK